MENYKQRVIDEKEALDIKREALRKFVMNKKEFEKLPANVQGLMGGQMVIMGQYADILAKRIKLFEGGE